MNAVAQALYDHFVINPAAQLTPEQMQAINAAIQIIAAHGGQPVEAPAQPASERQQVEATLAAFEATLHLIHPSLQYAAQSWIESAREVGTLDAVQYCQYQLDKLATHPADCQCNRCTYGYQSGSEY